MFRLKKREIADVEPVVYLAGADGLTLGVMAVLTGGSLALCGAAEEPTHMVMGKKSAAGKYPVIPVMAGTHFEVCADAKVAATLLGKQLKLTTTADNVQAAEGGAFLVEDTDGAAASTVVGRFVPLAV